MQEKESPTLIAVLVIDRNTAAVMIHIMITRAYTYGAPFDGLLLSFQL